MPGYQPCRFFSFKFESVQQARDQTYASSAEGFKERLETYQGFTDSNELATHLFEKKDSIQDNELALGLRFLTRLMNN